MGSPVVNDGMEDFHDLHFVSDFASCCMVEKEVPSLFEVKSRYAYVILSTVPCVGSKLQVRKSLMKLGPNILA